MKIRFFGSLILFVIMAFCTELNADDSTMLEVDLKNITVPVLCYHSVIPDSKSIYNFSPEQLESHLKYYKEHNYQPITALQYIKLQEFPEFFPEKPIVLTFDDGYKSHYQYVLPLLQKYNMKATFFVYPQVIKEESDVVLTWEELREMARAGMDIESHTMSHQDLSNYVLKGDDGSLSELEFELKSSREILESKLRRKVKLLAYPYGYYTKEVEEYAVKAGYEGIFTVNCGVNLPDENPLRIKRIALSNNMSMKEIELHITARPFGIDIISPTEASVVSEKPMLKFKAVNPGMKRINVMIRDTVSHLIPDQDGIYTLDPPIRKPGYYTVIINGYDTENYLNIGSWGFYYYPGYEKELLEDN